GAVRRWPKRRRRSSRRSCLRHDPRAVEGCELATGRKKPVKLAPVGTPAVAAAGATLVLALATGGSAASLHAGACAGVRARREVRPILALDPRPRAPRIFAMQFKQDLHNVTTYRRFQTKIQCLLREYVLPHLARGRANVVV